MGATMVSSPTPFYLCQCHTKGKSFNCGLCPPLALPIALLPVVVKSDINARHMNPPRIWQTRNS